MVKEVTKNIITPDLSALIDLRIGKALGDLNCTTIGTIQSFDATTQTASISVNYKRKVGEVFIEYPLLLDCPVVILGGGDSYLTFPIRAADPDNDIQGDTCIVMFCDRDIDIWFDSGQILAPNSTRKHNLSDGIALVGVRSNLNMLASYNETKASLIDRTGERLAQSGDTKTSMRTANHSGWLIMDGSTIGNADSGADYAGPEYEELFDILKESDSNTGSEVFADDDTVIIEAMNGRGAVGADDMGGSQADVLSAANQPNRNVLGGEIGEETHLLTGRESGIQQHNHSVHTLLGASTQGNGNNSNSNPSGVTGDAGHADALDSHNNVPPGKIMYWFVKI